MRAAGYDNEQIAEIIDHVALNLFTNTVNNALAYRSTSPLFPYARRLEPE